MTAQRRARPLLALALFGVLGCSLVVDSSDIDRGCGSGRKLCGMGHCVSQSDPAYGCTPDHCEPCELTNAIPTCSGETCVVSACLFGFDCPNGAGCLVNTLVSSDNCGQCGRACNAGQTCRNGQCADE